MEPAFDPMATWQLLLNGEMDVSKDHKANNRSEVNVFMAVPTVYAKLIQAHRNLFKTEESRRMVREILSSKIRLMVSGSAALPQV